MDEDELNARLAAAEADEAGRGARERVCRVLAATLRDAGDLLWTGGYLLGTDRREGESPFGFGNDATVGLAIVIQVGAELTQGAVSLFERGGVYAGAALLRQLVEVEYLAWAFAEDQAEARDWMRSSKGERLVRWQPRHLRERSAGRFRGADYAGHCERGGHPTPSATALLPGHSSGISPGLWWVDLAQHASSTWEYAIAAASTLEVDYSEQLTEIARRHRLAAAVAAWRRMDRLLEPASSGVFAARGHQQP
jgi:hypothetical protein